MNNGQPGGRDGRFVGSISGRGKGRPGRSKGVTRKKGGTMPGAMPGNRRKGFSGTIRPSGANGRGGR